MALHHSHQVVTSGLTPSTATNLWVVTQDWTNGAGGYGSEMANGETYDEDFWPPVAWPQSQSPGLVEWVWTPDDDFNYYWDITTNSSELSPVNMGEHCDVNWNYPLLEWGWQQRTADAEYKLATGGAQGSTQQNLWVISATAWAHTNAFDGYGTPVPPQQIQIGSLGNLDTNGNLYVLLPDNNPDNVTLKVNGSDKYTYPSPTVTEYQLHIIQNGNQDVTGSNVTAIVGQPINLTCQIEDANGHAPPAPWSITNYAWKVPGITFSDYVANASSGILYTAFPTTNSGVSYYWVDGGSKPVTCAVQAMGKTLSAQAVFNVKRPSVDWVGSIQDPIAADANNGYWGSGVYPSLHFGGAIDTNGHPIEGIVFTASNLNFDGSYDGNTFFFTQVGNGLATHCQSDGTSVHISFSGIDSADPGKVFYDFTTNSTASYHDSPYSPMWNTDIKIFRSNSFDTYLMFQPPSPSRPVPLKKISWNWSGAAIPDVSQSGSWTLVSSNAVITANNQDAFSHPVWTNNMDNQISTTNNLCQ
jgi:hypothetical protein